jgi:hypothetical protein
MLAAIGEVATESAAVDEKLRDLYGLLVGSPYAQLAVAGEATSRIVDLCSRTATFHVGLSDEAVERVLLIGKAVVELSSRRNLLVHAVWHKTTRVRGHIGTRSRQPGNAGNRDTTSEVANITVDDALAIGQHYRDAAAKIDEFIDSTFDLEPYGILISRKRNAAMLKWARDAGILD